MIFTIGLATRVQAWEEARKVFPLGGTKDNEASERAGYNIYKHSAFPYSRICDLGMRIEVLTGDYGEDITNIWIAPEILKNMGTGMTQEEYEKLAGSEKEKEWEISEAEAVLLINREFGFEASKIKLVNSAEVFVNDGGHVKQHEKYERTPQYCSTDYNYVRFDVCNWQYEMINGQLRFYYD